MKPVSSLLCLLALSVAGLSAQAAEKAASAPEPAKGATISTTVCAACHTNDGSRGSAANPIIQGQHPDYLVKQLAEFKAGKRDNPVMRAMASPLSEADMKNVAAFYAGKQAKPGFAKNKELVALGEKIYRGGVADRSVPACSGCHGPSGAGSRPSIRAWPGSMPTTSRRSWSPSAAGCAATIRSWRRSLPS